MRETFRNSMRWMHNWMGLLFGWILFFIFLTGTLGYFDSEIDRWMRPELPKHERKFKDEVLTAMAIEHLNTYASHSTKWVIYLPNHREESLSIKWYDPTKHATKFKPPHGNANEYIKFIDPNKNSVVDVRETGGGQLLYKMHYLLHYVSSSTGRIIVGIASMVMLIGLITGIIIHINIFKGFFTFSQEKSVKSWFDGHLLTGVIALPFHIMITYSGLVFFVFFYVTVIPLANYGKEMRMMIAEVFPSHKAVRIAHVPTKPIDLTSIVIDAKKEFEFIKKITIINPYDKSRQVEVKQEYSTLLKGNSIDKLYYDGITYKRIQKPELNKPSSSYFRSILTGLHTGLFADNIFRWVYFISGLLGCFMIATGLVFWTKKREYKQKDTIGFKIVNSINAATIVGLCSGIGAYFIANRVLEANLVNRIAYEINTLFIVWLITFVVAFVSKREWVWIIQFYIVAVIFISIPILNFFYTNKHLINTINQNDNMLVTFDILLFITGIIFAFLGYKKGKKRC